MTQPTTPSTSHEAPSISYKQAQLSTNLRCQDTCQNQEYVQVLPRFIAPLTEWQRAREEIYRDDNTIELTIDWVWLDETKAERLKHYLPLKYNRGRSSWAPIANTLCAINDQKWVTAMTLEIHIGDRTFYNHTRQLERWGLIQIEYNRNKATYIITPGGRLVAEALRDGRDSITKLRDTIKHLDMSDYPTHRALQILMDEAILRYEVNP